MNLSRNLSMVLMVVGIVIIIVALLMHFLVTALILPHLNVYIAVIGVILAAVGAWGLFGGKQRA